MALVCVSCVATGDYKHVNILVTDDVTFGFPFTKKTYQLSKCCKTSTNHSEYLTITKIRLMKYVKVEVNPVKTLTVE